VILTCYITRSLFISSIVLCSLLTLSSLFFFNDPPTTEIYTLSLHDALPISRGDQGRLRGVPALARNCQANRIAPGQFRASAGTRSEEHTSELQSPYDLVCRLLLEKKKKKKKKTNKRKKKYKKI